MMEINGVTYYSVQDISEHIPLKRARITSLCKDMGVTKFGNKYFATWDQVMIIKNRPNQTFKPEDLDKLIGEA